MHTIGFQDPTWQYALKWLCSVVSYSILVITFFYKAPQVYAVVHSRSSVGISMPSLLLEFSSYSIEMTYQFAMGYKLDTYFEVTLMWFQDIILLWVVIVNRRLLKPSLLFILAAYLALFVSIALRLFPDVIMTIFVSSTTPILFVSKSAQLWTIVSTRDPGSLSALTWGLLSYLAAGRILTTLVMTGDLPILANNTTASILDMTVTISIIYYNHLKRNRRRRSRPR